MLLELADPQGAPARCLTCLSARPPRVRLAAAGALERFANPAAFREYVVQLVNDRGDEPPWKINAETVETLAALLAYGSPRARARTAHLLRHLSEKEPAAWEQAWTLHTARFAADIRTLREAASERKRTTLLYTAGQLQELAFGAYVGLVREQGGSEQQVSRVRQTALSRLQTMAKPGRQQVAVFPVFVQALDDPNQAVRQQAFDQLADLGVDVDTLGAAALGAGHTDIGVRGLEKLAGGGTSAEGQAVLEDALRTRTDELAIEAAKLLAARRGVVSVAGLALGASHEPLRRQAIDWLAAEYDKAPAARDLLRQALQSRHSKVVTAAAFALAVKKDPAAFDALVRLLREAKEEGPQRRLIATLKELGDPRAADAFLDRVEEDADGTALVDELFEAAGTFRRPETADRLLVMGEKEKWGKALAAAYVVSGHDQEIEDSEDENPDRRWEQKQFPRHDAILVRLLRRATDLKANRALTGFLTAVRWARSRDVDPGLAVLTVYAADDIRRRALEAVGWRLRKRGGPAEPLVKALRHRDLVTRFLAAEGLALGGRTEGLSAPACGRRSPRRSGAAVASGHRAGQTRRPAGLDLLLKIVNDPEHALREAAAEAVGHMGKSPKARRDSAPAGRAGAWRWAAWLLLPCMGCAGWTILMAGNLSASSLRILAPRTRPSRSSCLAITTTRRRATCSCVCWRKQPVPHWWKLPWTAPVNCGAGTLWSRITRPCETRTASQRCETFCFGGCRSTAMRDGCWSFCRGFIPRRPRTQGHPAGPASAAGDRGANCGVRP